MKKSKIRKLAEKKGNKVYYRENGKLVPIEGLTILTHKTEYHRGNKAKGIKKGDFLIRKFLLRHEKKVRLSHHPVYNPTNIKAYLIVEDEHE